MNQEAPASSRLPTPALLAGIALIGAAISFAIGIYANQHTATGRSILGDGLFFSSTLSFKAWFATAAVTLALVQLYTSLRMYGKVPFPRHLPPWWFRRIHRLSGTAAFLISLPVAYHCIWALGFHLDSVDTRVAVHGLLGCFFYGAFAAKMLFLRVRALPGMVLPIVGGLTFASVVGIWLTSAYWFFQNFGFPNF